MIYNFEWDPKKAEINTQKHGINFEEATTVFRDPLALTIFDPDHSESENRWLTNDISRNRKLLVVCHTFEEIDSNTVVVRMFSGRKATKSESKQYGE